MNIFHRTTWTGIDQEVFTLVPGPQAAQGIGVYWSVDHVAPINTAEGCRGEEGIIIVCDDYPADGWRKGKSSIAAKFGKPVAWNSNGKSCACTVLCRMGNKINVKMKWD